MKRCCACEQEKPLGDFYSRADRSVGVMSICKSCDNERTNAWRRANLTKSRLKNRRADLKRHHNMTADQWDAMFAAQGGRCAICGTDEPGGISETLHVDHDHQCCPIQGRSCGKCVRGLLCTRCNTGLGQFQDDPVRLRRAAEYLEGRAMTASNSIVGEVMP